MSSVITDEVRRLVADQANRAPSSISLDDHLEDDLYLDDLDRLELQIAVEEELQRSFDDDAWLACETLQDLIELIEQYGDYS